MYNISNNNFSIDSFSNCQLVGMLSSFDIESLQNCSLINHRFRDVIFDNFLWKQVATNIGVYIAPMDEKQKSDNTFVRNKVFNYILELKKEIKALHTPREPLPKDIENIIHDEKFPTFKEIQCLQKYRQARDIFIVWKALAVAINPNLGNSLDASNDLFKPFTFATSKDLFQFVKGFKKWCDDNQDKLSKIEQLPLAFRKLKTLPTEVGQLANLKVLYLSDNNLASLPAEIGKLSQLQKLHLRNNQLTSLPVEIEQLSQLKLLDLTNNKLTSLPAEIGKLSQLTDLFLQKNPLTFSAEEIEELFTQEIDLIID